MKLRNVSGGVYRYQNAARLYGTGLVIQPDEVFTVDATLGEYLLGTFSDKFKPEGGPGGKQDGTKEAKSRSGGSEKDPPTVAAKP